MGREILYDRAFIKMGDKYIPIINQGSSNCFEYGDKGLVAEKYWNVINYRCRNKVIFTEEEILNIAEHMEQLSQEGGAIMKSRNRAFGTGELLDWILAGMKRAYTVEEYHACGNTLMFTYCGPEERNSISFTTTQQLEELIASHSDAKELNISFANNRTVYRPKKPKVDKLVGLEKVYALAKKDDKGRIKYLCRYRRRRIVYATDISLPFVRLFSSEKEARGYLNRYRQKNGPIGLDILCVHNPRKAKGENEV